MYDVGRGWILGNGARVFLANAPAH